jgi:xanthine dehydrogenase accessory factor
VIIKIEKGSNVVTDIILNGRPMLGLVKDPEILRLAEEALRSNMAIEETMNEFKVRVEPFEARPTVIIVGSGLVAKALARLANYLGYYVAVVGNGDVNNNDFSMATLITNNLEDLGRLVTEGSIVLIANEGGKPYDADALHIAITRGASFVGLLASQKRGAVMIAEMIRRGVSLDTIKARLHTPMGIDIGGKTAEEVALSIMAEVVMEIRHGSGKRMMEVKDPYKLLNDALEGKITEQSCSWKPSTVI